MRQLAPDEQVGQSGTARVLTRVRSIRLADRGMSSCPVPRGQTVTRDEYYRLTEETAA